MSRVYSFSSYDKHLCLKVGLELWLSILFLLRPFVVTILSVVNRKDPMSIINFIYADRRVLVLAVLASIPAMFVVFAWLKKTPTSPAFIRKLWQRGAMILMVSAALNVVIVFVPLMTGAARSVNTMGWGQLGVSLLIIGYLYFSERVRDTFADFPSETTDK